MAAHKNTALSRKKPNSGALDQPRSLPPRVAVAAAGAVDVRPAKKRSPLLSLLSLVLYMPVESMASLLLSFEVMTASLVVPPLSLTPVVAWHRNASLKQRSSDESALFTGVGGATLSGK